MTKDQANANDRMTNEGQTRLSQLQQEIHDALRVQHPEMGFLKTQQVPFRFSL